MSRARRLVVLAVVLVGLALGASGCTKVVADEYVERVGADFFQSGAGAKVTVHCPAGVEMRIDNDFFCTTDFYGRHGTLLVRQLDDYGHVKFTREQPVAHAQVEADAEAYLRGQAGIPTGTRVRCPHRVVPKEGRSFTCRSAVGRIRVVQVDGVSTFHFELERHAS
ncbi:MAG: hypothetical protein JWM98_2900 [Thermoleophilia bacterium]|nr:hypothetical protein [Thermoleophilia bacterium]